MHFPLKTIGPTWFLVVGVVVLSSPPAIGDAVTASLAIVTSAVLVRFALWTAGRRELKSTAAYAGNVIAIRGRKSSTRCSG